MSVRRLRRGTGVRTGDGSDRSCRQLIATTHSPALLAALRGDLSGSLVFLHGDQDARDERLKLVAELEERRPLLDRAGMAVPLIRWRAGWP
ncbi:hypothetical protein QEZ40_002556 [Streptomyces katrae]|uniref:ATPase AAA-type core domain-containing protein n=1 Tax=Streptomyces katrae TaxID=68223 RepID=A0ABT7GVF8_9ACTN|nr:hypothetical protein [Streptomyces katrae]MDK9497615.1 hypothetical protein [Streptomyces katrae]